MEQAALLEEVADSSAISPEQRIELMELAKTLRHAADRIDVITQQKQKREVDENYEPFFRFNAKVKIPKDFFLTKRMSKYALDMGFTQKAVIDMANQFVIFYNKSGKKWQDWTRVWQDWVRREFKRLGTTSTPVTTDRMKRW